MKAPGHCFNQGKRRRFARQSGFTMVELLVASTCGSLALASAVVFMNFARISLSGIAAQAKVSDNAAGALAFLQSRIRVATSVAVDAAGNKLTLGFDDDYTVDSDGDGSAYNDKDHYETFQFVGTNSTNSASCGGNSLIYTPKVGVANSWPLVRSGVRNLPSNNIFAIANTYTVLIRFGVVDPSARDRFQAVDIQATGIPLNRPVQSNFVGILP